MTRPVALGLMLLLASCASHQLVKMVPVRGDGDRTVMLGRAVPLSISDDPGRTLPDSSKWRRIGAIAQGDVYRRLDDRFVVRVEGREREAHLVESNGKLVGFYLPGESWFVPLSSPMRMPAWQR